MDIAKDVKNKCDALAYAIEQTENWYIDNQRRMVSVRETALKAITLYLEFLTKEA